MAVGPVPDGDREHGAGRAARGLRRRRNRPRRSRRARWFNTAAFAAAPTERRGNATVGMIEGPHWRQADVSLRKLFRFSPSKNIELRADVFNVFNTREPEQPQHGNRQHRLRHDHERADSAPVAVQSAVHVLAVVSDPRGPSRGGAAGRSGAIASPPDANDGGAVSRWTPSLPTPLPDANYPSPVFRAIPCAVNRHP